MRAPSACILGLALAASAGAHDFSAGPLMIERPWARATPPAAQTGAAYFTLHNSGDADERLVSVDAPIARRAELHAHQVENGVMRMRQVAAIVLPPGGQVALQPGGLHVMLIGLEAPLRVDESFPFTLTFERAGRVTIQISVQQGDGADHLGHSHGP